MFFYSLRDLLDFTLAPIKSNKIKIDQMISLSIFVVLIAFIVQLFTDKPNEIGDWLAGFASLLAFTWLIYGSFMQRDELSMQRDELKLQRESIRLQTSELQNMSKLSALEFVRERLKEMDLLFKGDEHTNLDHFTNKYLPTYLKESESFIRDFRFNEIPPEVLADLIGALENLRRLIAKAIKIYSSTAHLFFDITDNQSFIKATSNINFINLQQNTPLLLNTPYFEEHLSNILRLHAVGDMISTQKGKANLLLFEQENDYE